MSPGSVPVQPVALWVSQWSYGVPVCHAQSLSSLSLDFCTGLHWWYCHFSRNFDDHCKRLQQVFQTVIHSNITLSPKKCHISYQSLLLLGHKVSCLGVSTHKEKLDVVVGMAAPTNWEQLQTFLGKVVYFMSMIPFSTWIAALLFALLEKDAKWI